MRGCWPWPLRPGGLSSQTTGGFGEMTVRHGQPAVGVIILSLYALSAGARETYAIEKIAEIADRTPGHLTIIEPGRIRIRPLPTP